MDGAGNNGPRQGGSLRYGIVGGTGMLGSWLAGALRARGDAVVVITRGEPRDESHVQWDPAAARPVANLRALERIDVLYNLGGAPLADRPWTKQRRRVLGESRVKATEALLGVLEALEAPPRVFIGAGGLGYFGDRGDEILDDDDVPGAGFLAELCVEWEQASLDAARRIGARSAVLRMSVALSPTGGAFPLMVRAFRYFGGWLGHGRQYTPWISVHDAIGAFLHLADREECRGAFNGTVPNPTPNKEWMKALGRVLHRPVLTHAPRWALRGALGELADSMLIASIRAVPRKLTDTGFQWVDAEPEATFAKLKEELDQHLAEQGAERPRRRQRVR